MLFWLRAFQLFIACVGLIFNIMGSFDAWVDIRAAKERGAYFGKVRSAGQEQLFNELTWLSLQILLISFGIIGVLGLRDSWVVWFSRVSFIGLSVIVTMRSINARRARKEQRSHTMDKLHGIHPELVHAITAIFEEMSQLGYTMIITDGIRTTEQQQALYAQGRTKPGQIVTQLDGVHKRSNHQVHSDGWGHAVDVTFLVDGKPSWADTLPWNTFGAIVKRHHLVWGGDWHSIVDRPHVELP